MSLEQWSSQRRGGWNNEFIVTSSQPEPDPAPLQSYVQKFLISVCVQCAAWSFCTVLDELTQLKQLPSEAFLATPQATSSALAHACAFTAPSARQTVCTSNCLHARKPEEETDRAGRRGVADEVIVGSAANERVQVRSDLGERRRPPVLIAHGHPG